MRDFKRSRIKLFTLLLVLSACIWCLNGSAQASEDPELRLMGNRFFTFNTVVRVNQIETSRNEVHGEDESAIHSPAEARVFREAVEKGWPGARMTWSFSWQALNDQRSNYKELRELIVSYHKKYGDEITFIPGGYFANMYNSREQVNRDLHDGLQLVSEMVGDGYRPRSVLAGFLSAENLRYLAEEEGIHVCQGNIWSQYAVDNGDGEGSICYPYYPSREHFCKPAQGTDDFIDIVNLDGWTIDFISGMQPGGRRIGDDWCGSRQGVGPIETVIRIGTERGTKEMLATTATHFDRGFELNGFAWVTCCWEMSLVEARKIYNYKGRNGLDGLLIWFSEMRKRWPEAKCITQGEFGLLWREHYKNNDDIDYQFVQRGSGICGSDPELEIRWFMNQDYRMALLRNWKEGSPEKVIDFTRYDLKAEEPADPTPGEPIRNWSLMNSLNQKGTRPQDIPTDIGDLNEEEKSLIMRRHPELIDTRENNGVYPGADEGTPSLSQYFSWINNTNEGSTEAQTLINLDFFNWLRKEYGMILDIYVVSAGAIDKGSWYGSMESEEFKAQFPNGFDPIYRKAKEMGTRLGTWGGPDGFGNTPEEEQARTDMIVKLCRDYEFQLLKFDAVVGQLRDDKQESFINMMTECRKYSPDLILLNHRLNLGEEAEKHATTSLWGGEETYIDVHMPNWRITAPHHRATAISRDVVPGLMRLTEDHGVCLSSCLDYWEDDLILQAFNRNLILSPQIYGNPWFLRDDEYPKLARIFNLARLYGPIMVKGGLLPEESYGEKAVSRGNSDTRLISLRNTGWEPSEVQVSISSEIGITEDIRYEARLLHPVERILGSFELGEKVTVPVDPFRAALVLVCPEGKGGAGIKGCDYEVFRDVPGKPLSISLKGLPGTEHSIKLNNGGMDFSSAELDGKSVKALLKGKSLKVRFPGETINEAYHRKIADLQSCEVPPDAELLYEASVFSADNNALEIRELDRSGPSLIPEVQAAREAFLDQPLFAERGVWDRFMFDGDPETSFYVCRRRRRIPLQNGGSLRLDFGKAVVMDELVIEVGSEHAMQPWKSGEAVFLEVSEDLRHWQEIRILAKHRMRIEMDPEKPVRYVRFRGTPDRISEIEGYLDGQALDRSGWKGSNLFSPYRRIEAEHAWSASTTINEIHPGSYLAVALEGEHGVEGAYAALRVDGKVVGAPDRSPSYQVNPWEYLVAEARSHYTYYIPLKKEMEGKNMDIIVLGMKGGKTEFKPVAYLTSNPEPYQKKELKLYRNK